MKFCDILRELLEENDITQKQLALDLNIGVTTIGNYVRGIREPDFETLKLIAAYFDVSIDYLLNFRSGFTRDHREDEILRIFRSLSPDFKDLMTENGKILKKHDIINSLKQKNAVQKK